MLGIAYSGHSAEDKSHTFSPLFLLNLGLVHDEDLPKKEVWLCDACLYHLVLCLRVFDIFVLALLYCPVFG